LTMHLQIAEFKTRK